MGKLFTLDASTRSTITDALDDIISEFGKLCLLVYPPKWTPCPSCSAEAAGRRSSDVWRTGGRVPFSAGSACQLCDGAGQRAEELSEQLKLKLEWDPKKFWRPVPDADVRVPHSVCQAKGFVSDYPKIKAADHLVIQLPVEPFVRVKFRLAGEPISPGNIVQDRYLISDWEQ